MAGAWTKISITVKTEDLDRATAVISMLDNGLMIEDYSDFSLNGMYGELVDETILEADKTHAKISLFVPEDKKLSDYIEYINSSLPRERIAYKTEVEGVNEDDWADSWKQYSAPIHIGRVTIAPSWNEYEGKEGEIVIRLDPGMAFGTGSHETTRLVMKIMQDVISGGETMLDIGCGSGILSICGLALGAKKSYAYDIDPVAVRVTRENAEASGCADRIKAGVSDLLSGVEAIPHGYGVCVANIVAEIIIRMLPDIRPFLKRGAPIILSGIVTEKETEVIKAANECGFTVVRTERENDWSALMLV